MTPTRDFILPRRDFSAMLARADEAAMLSRLRFAAAWQAAFLIACQPADFRGMFFLPLRAFRRSRVARQVLAYAYRRLARRKACSALGEEVWLAVMAATYGACRAPRHRCAMGRAICFSAMIEMPAFITTRFDYGATGAPRRWRQYSPVGGAIRSANASTRFIFTIYEYTRRMIRSTRGYFATD